MFFELVYRYIPFEYDMFHKIYDFDFHVHSEILTKFLVFWMEGRIAPFIPEQGDIFQGTRLICFTHACI